MGILLEVEFQTVAILSGIGAVSTAILVDISMRLHVTVQHGFVHTGVVAFVAFKRLGAEMISEMVFKMMLVFSDKWTLGALQNLVRLDVLACMIPEVML